MFAKTRLAAALLLIMTSLAMAQNAPELPAAPVQPKVKTACQECHDAGILVQQRLSKGAWTKEVDKMIRWGAVVDPKDRDAFIDYLRQFSPDKPPYQPPPPHSAKTKR